MKWQKVKTRPGEYLAPTYYDSILKKYVFDGKEDLELLRDSLQQIPSRSAILELGVGSGRATEIILGLENKIASLTLVDLSDRMITFCKARFSDLPFIQYSTSDTIKFLLDTGQTYDFVYCLWSLSHSIHQNLRVSGFEKGGERVKRALARLFTKILKRNGKLLLIHFDSESEEQKISIAQRKRDDPIFPNGSTVSPSKVLLDSVLKDLKQRSLISYSCTHYIGDALEFNSTDQALEYYLNFHMETHFNDAPNIEEIIRSLTKDIEKHKGADGIIRIKPAGFVYEVTRL